jgi:hypothetical protein
MFDIYIMRILQKNQHTITRTFILHEILYSLSKLHQSLISKLAWTSGNEKNDETQNKIQQKEFALENSNRKGSRLVYEEGLQER